MCCQPAPIIHAGQMAAAGAAGAPSTILLNNGQELHLDVRFPFPDGCVGVAPVPWQTFVLNANGGVYR